MAATKKKPKRRERKERRFFPTSGANPTLIRVVGGIGAMMLGAGAWGQFGIAAPEPIKSAQWLLAAGAGIFGLAIWFSTSGDPAIRVGDGGLGVDRGGVLRRVPWHAVTSVTWDSNANAVVVKGNDEAEKELVVNAKLKSQRGAAARIVKEARRRIGDVVDLSDAALEAVGAAKDSEGELLDLEPVQVVGKRCAKSRKTIAYEPDARVCPRCERVYHKNFVPKKCACGEAIGYLRDPSAPVDEDEDDDEEDAEAEAPSDAADDDEAPESSPEASKKETA
jgi:hypothetical protein